MQFALICGRQVTVPPRIPHSMRDTNGLSHERRHEFACSGTFRRVNTPTHAMLPSAKQLRFRNDGWDRGERANRPNWQSFTTVIAWLWARTVRSPDPQEVHTYRVAICSTTFGVFRPERLGVGWATQPPRHCTVRLILTPCTVTKKVGRSSQAMPVAGSTPRSSRAVTRMA